LAYEGGSAEEIATLICLSAGTVRDYSSQAVAKLEANNRIEASRMAW